MVQLIDPAARNLAAATLLGAFVLASPLWAGAEPLAGAGASSLLAQAAPAPGQSSAAPAKAKRSMTDRVEARIKSLHDRLKITSVQEPQWGAVAQVMRDNAQQMEAAIEQRQQARGMTAIDDLKAYQGIADAHAQGLQKLVPAFQALYDSLSDEQKKNADTIFGQSRHRGHRKSSK
jgi:protein CpxP